MAAVPLRFPSKSGSRAFKSCDVRNIRLQLGYDSIKSNSEITLDSNERSLKTTESESNLQQKWRIYFRTHRLCENK